jgi:hypothetical protein
MRDPPLIDLTPGAGLRIHRDTGAQTVAFVLAPAAGAPRLILVVVPPGPLPPVISSDGVNPDLQLVPSERAALLAYLRKL